MEMPTCQNCGSKNENGAKFCRNCGKEIIIDEVNDNINQNPGSEIVVKEELNEKYCRNCGFKIPDDTIKYCPSCGAPTSPTAQANEPGMVLKPGKSPVLAAILSFFIIGLGQLYIGLTKKGILLFIAAIVCGILGLIIIGWILWLIVWLYAIYDAYNSANKMNRGVGVKDTIDLHDL